MYGQVPVLYLDLIKDSNFVEDKQLQEIANAYHQKTPSWQHDDRMNNWNLMVSNNHTIR